MEPPTPGRRRGARPGTRVRFAIHHLSVQRRHPTRPVGPEWQLVGTVDFNGDGTPQRTSDQILMIYDTQKPNFRGELCRPRWPRMAGRAHRRLRQPVHTGILFQRGDGALMVDDVVSNRVTSSTIAGQLAAGRHLYGIGDTNAVMRQQRRAHRGRSHCQPSPQMPGRRKGLNRYKGVIAARSGEGPLTEPKRSSRWASRHHSSYPSRRSSLQRLGAAFNRTPI